MIRLLAVLLLAACGATERPALPPQPVNLATCGSAMKPPEPPPPPNTVETLAKLSRVLYQYVGNAERARNDCAKRLGELNGWIDDQRKRLAGS